MANRVHHGERLNAPHFRLTELVIDHLSHAQEFPDRMAELARRLNVGPHIALAIAIADNIIEEFEIKIRE